MPRHIDSEEFVNRFFLTCPIWDLFSFKDHDDLQLSTKKNNIHLNTNNSNNNRSSTRIATIKSAKRDHKGPPNVNIYFEKFSFLIQKLF
jgi:hypothetical protein